MRWKLELTARASCTLLKVEPVGSYQPKLAKEIYIPMRKVPIQEMHGQGLSRAPERHFTNRKGHS